MEILEGWRGFYFPPGGYKLDNEGNPVIEQPFVHNFNSRIIQVMASGTSLVPMSTPPSVHPQITPFVITDDITADKYFGPQGTRHQHSDNSVSSVFIKGIPYTGPVYNDKGNRLT